MRKTAFAYGKNKGADQLKRMNSFCVFRAIKAKVFFIFRLTDPPDPIFWKLKKKRERLFSILILDFPPTHATTVLEFSYVFSLCLFYCCQAD